MKYVCVHCLSEMELNIGFDNIYVHKSTLTIEGAGDYCKMTMGKYHGTWYKRQLLAVSVKDTGYIGIKELM